VTDRPVLALADVGGRDMSVVGPKAARLGELIGAGLPVPDGVVLSVDVHRTALAVAGVAEQVAAGVAELIERVGGAGDLDQRVAALREVAGRAEMSVGHRSALLAAYRSLTSGDADAGGIGPAVAVRSSAIGEDTEDASFAGTYDSVTDVVGADAVLAAVGVCWSSSVSTRSIAYRAGMARQPSGVSDPAMAVIVQRMAPSQRSGVMFTVDPRAAVDRLVIEAVGAGGSVVSGGSDPERFEVDRTSGIIVEATRPSDDRDPSATSAPVLSHAEVAALNELGRSIEDHFGTPQDVEWTIGSDGSIWIVQSRPITGRPATGPGSATPGAGGTIPTSGSSGAEPPWDDPDAVLTGTGASAGTARGLARVLRSPGDAPDLLDGEVLVAPTTSPEWMPALMRAAAVVTDTGGMASHAAIVARERRIPCVVGVAGATERLVDGEVVTVDGSAGTVSRSTRS